MRLNRVPALLALQAVAISASTILLPRSGGLAKRAQEFCEGLSVATNNGDRKVAIVIDSSGSMSSNDPGMRRLDAGRALNDFLISNAEAGPLGKTPDQISIIDFDDSATVLYPLGDPGNAAGSFKTDASGGTNIASGVNLAFTLLSSSSSGPTQNRAAIVVLTDGEDSNTSALVAAIKKATAAGIRVSFGFLDPSASNQASSVLEAVRESRGAYATITSAAGSINFINYVLLNGLTFNDNPQGFDSQLLAGLSQTYAISGSNTVQLRYSARQGELITFRVVGFSAGPLTSVAQMGGSPLGNPVTSSSSVSGGVISVTAPSSGQIDLLVTARSAGQNALFSVSTSSNIPIKNCTLAVIPTDSGGLSTGAKAGIGVGATIAALGLLGGGGYFAYKHFHVGGSGGGLSAPAGDGGFSAPVGDGGISSAPAGPANTSGFPPTPGQGGIGMPPGGDGGLAGGQYPLAPPPGPGGVGPPPMSGGGPGVFVPVFVPPVVPKANNDNLGNYSPSTQSATPMTPLPPSQSPYSPISNHSPPLGFPFGQHPDGLQHTIGHGGPPQELVGNHGDVSPPPGHGGLSGTYEMATPNHTGSSFSPGSGNTGPLPSGHGDLGPHNHTGFGAPGSGPVGYGPPSGPTPPPGGVNTQVFIPSSGFGFSDPDKRRRRHHHHPWLGGMPCEDGDCHLHSDSHPCGDGCDCMCRDPHCPLNQ